MLLINPLTRQVLNANPQGCNQYTKKNCAGVQGKFYKDARTKEFYGPYDTDDDVLMAHVMANPDAPGIRRSDGSRLAQDIDNYTLQGMIEDGYVMRPRSALRREWNISDEKIREWIKSMD
jgi:hypothetical protein